MSGAPTANAAFKHAKTGVQGINRPAGLVRHLLYTYLPEAYAFARAFGMITQSMIENGRKG